MNTDKNLDTVLNHFTDRTAGITHIVAVSCDGLLLAHSAGLDRNEAADQLAAVASGLVSLLHGAARLFAAGDVIVNLTEMTEGYMLSMAVSSGASLLALITRDADISQVTEDMTRLINQVAPALNPQRTKYAIPGQR